ncbi:hypothetical protein LCGC14_1583660 [marine sediment metagenome]|uniref:Uncharacterized protein n=1 Tax=marine sediment metagenome TaxID=412755 RepID=A0A0F9KWS8_9ZZZZ
MPAPEEKSDKKMEMQERAETYMDTIICNKRFDGK